VRWFPSGRPDRVVATPSEIEHTFSSCETRVGIDRRAAAGGATTKEAPVAAASTPTPNPEKDPEDWVTGDEPMTGPQASYLHTLAQEADVEVADDLTKAEASEKIDELQAATGRGAG
jgi:hypothetical protein